MGWRNPRKRRKKKKTIEDDKKRIKRTGRMLKEIDARMTKSLVQ